MVPRGEAGAGLGRTMNCSRGPGRTDARIAAHPCVCVRDPGFGGAGRMTSAARARDRAVVDRAMGRDHALMARIVPPARRRDSGGVVAAGVQDLKERLNSHRAVAVMGGRIGTTRTILRFVGVDLNARVRIDSRSEAGAVDETFRHPAASAHLCLDERDQEWWPVGRIGRLKATKRSNI